MSDRHGAVAPAAACIPPSEARAARLAKFKREQLIVDFLNRGVSVAEIAARVGVGEKRMRANIREILARRMPHPPEEFVAIQVSRVSEAMAVAFSAMSPTNLKAVGQVVKIVRELDRYGGAFAAEWARPEASRLDAPAEEDAAFARAWLSGGEPALPDSKAASPGLGVDARPENPAQTLEKVESAPGNPTARETSAEAYEAAPSDLVPNPGSSTRMSKDASLNAHGAAPAGDDRPQNPAQPFEMLESAPGTGSAALGASATCSAHDERRLSRAAPPGLPNELRPGNPPQRLDKLEFRARE